MEGQRPPGALGNPATRAFTVALFFFTAVTIARFAADGEESAEPVVRRADEALYAAKELGRDRTALAAA